MVPALASQPSLGRFGNISISTHRALDFLGRNGDETLVQFASWVLPNPHSSTQQPASSRPFCLLEMATVAFPPVSNATTISIGFTRRPTCEEDWEPHRARIRQLYLEEDRTLKDVMGIMEREHGFKATSGPPIPHL